MRRHTILAGAPKSELLDWSASDLLQTFEDPRSALPQTPAIYCPIQCSLLLFGNVSLLFVQP